MITNPLSIIACLNWRETSFLFELWSIIHLWWNGRTDFISNEKSRFLKKILINFRSYSFEGKNKTHSYFLKKKEYIPESFFIILYTYAPRWRHTYTNLVLEKQTVLRRYSWQSDGLEGTNWLRLRCALDVTVLRTTVEIHENGFWTALAQTPICSPL